MHLRLAERILLRKFDKPFAYNAKTDELYELDYDALNFLFLCDGRNFEEVEENLLNFLINEGIVEISKKPKKNEIISPDEPSLRYLLVNITWKCNLKCVHCYVEQENSFMDFETFKKVVDQFYDIGGLKLIISGGEPLLHPEIWKFLRYAKRKPFRLVLLTNGLLIDEKYDKGILEKLKIVDEIQISLDGMKGHEILRGVSYKLVLNVIKKVVESGIDVSVSTMITKFNMDEFEEMAKILRGIGIKRWLIDFPSCDKSMVPEFFEARKILLDYGFGELGHEGSKDYACGAHFASITPDGKMTKCGFFNESVGDAEDLEKAWDEMKRKYIWKIDELKCECDYKDECKGGCRFRALNYTGNLFDRDPVMCSIFRLH